MRDRGLLQRLAKMCIRDRLIYGHATRWAGTALPLVGALSPWRITIVCAALFGPFVAILFMFTREPQRRERALVSTSRPQGGLTLYSFFKSDPRTIVTVLGLSLIHI